MTEKYDEKLPSTIKKLPSTIRNCVWVTYVGESNKYLCFCCNVEPITRANFECGHIQAKSKNGPDTIDNLRPICSLCNKSMGTTNMETFMNNHGLKKNSNWNGRKGKLVGDASNREDSVGNPESETIITQRGKLKII